MSKNKQQIWTLWVKDCSIANKNKFKSEIQHLIEEQNSTLIVGEGTRLREDE